jgi:hypothetical protein
MKIILIPSLLYKLDNEPREGTEADEEERDDRMSMTVMMPQCQMMLILFSPAPKSDTLRLTFAGPTE